MSKIKSKSKPVAVETQTPEPVTFKVTSASLNVLSTAARKLGEAMVQTAQAITDTCNSIRKVAGGKPLDDATLDAMLTATQKGGHWTGKDSIKAQRTKYKAVYQSYATLPRAIKALGENPRFKAHIGNVGTAHAFYMANKLNKPTANVSKIVGSTVKFFVKSRKAKGKDKVRTFATAADYKRHVAIVIKALLAAKITGRGAGEVKQALRDLGGVVNLGKA